MKYGVIGFILAFLVGSIALAQEPNYAPEAKLFDVYDIQSVSIKLNRVSESKVDPNPPSMKFTDIPIPDWEAMPQGGASALEIVDLLLKMWDIVDKNRPVVNVNTPNAAALPKIAEQNWMALTGWLPERSLEYAIEARNGFGMSPVTFVYSVRLMAGGSVKGKGKYIARAGVFPKTVDVWTAYKLDVGVNASVQNVGTAANPIAAITLDVNTTISSPLRSTTQGQSFLLRGDGMMKDINEGTVYFRGASGPF